MKMDLDHHTGMCAPIPLLLSYSTVVSMLNRQSGDRCSIPGSCTNGGEKLFKQAPLAGNYKPATWLLKS